MQVSLFIKLISVFFTLFLAINICGQDNNKLARELFDDGNRLIKEGKFEEALKILRQSLKLEPRNAAIYNSLGSAHLSLRQYDKAVENLSRAALILPQDAGIKNNLCLALGLDKQFEKAVSNCEEAVRLDPDSADKRWLLVNTFYQAKRFDEAIKAAETALVKFEEDEGLLYILGGVYAAKGNFAKVLAINEKLVKAKPNVSAYRVALSEGYLAFDRVEEAAQTARKAIELDVLNPFAYYRLAKVYSEIGLNEEAVSALQKAVELKPDAGEIYLLYGENLAKLGNKSQAIINLREAVRLLPDYSPAQYILGKNLIEDARFAEAVEPLRQADKLKPNDLDTKVALGTALLESGNYDNAIRSLEEAIRLGSNNSLIQMLLDVSKGRKQGVARIEKVKQQVAADPRNIEALKYLGNLYLYTGNIREAERLMLEAFKLEPESGESNNDMAVFYSDARRFDIAVRYLRRAVELKRHHILYLSLATNLSKLGKTQEALEAYRKGIEVKPNSIYLLKPYADALRDAGKRSEAIEVYKKVIEIEPRNAPTLFNLSYLSLKLLDTENAKRYYEILRTVEPQTAKNLAWIFRLLK